MAGLIKKCIIRHWLVCWLNLYNAPTHGHEYITLEKKRTTFPRMTTMREQSCSKRQNCTAPGFSQSKQRTNQKLSSMKTTTIRRVDSKKIFVEHEFINTAQTILISCALQCTSPTPSKQQDNFKPQLAVDLALAVAALVSV